MQKTKKDWVIAPKSKYTSRHSDLLEATIKEVFRKQGLEATKLSRIIYEQLGYKTPACAYGYLSYLAEGYIYGTTGRPVHRQARMLSLAIVLDTLEIPHEHPFIIELKNLDNYFYYPEAAYRSHAKTEITDILDS
jgi:hypothetical protein